MSIVQEIVLHQVLMEGPQIEDPRKRERYIDETINAMTNVELLERISNAIEASKGFDP
jgi:hypothetical protein